MIPAGATATAVACEHKPLVMMLLTLQYFNQPQMVQAMLVIAAAVTDCERQARVLHVAQYPFSLLEP